MKQLLVALGALWHMLKELVLGYLSLLWVGDPLEATIRIMEEY